MAGGYKLFSTGEVLTAANVNNYLMKQTVMVFADAATRTTALSGVLTEGMLSYRTDGHLLERYSGSAWVALGSVSSLVASTGLTGGTITSTGTIAIDTAVTADLTTAQTLTNKTLTSPLINLGINANTATTYTFVLSDNGKLVTSNNASAQTLSIPTNASVAFPIGAQINVAWITGAGQPTINAVTSGTTTVLSTGATSTAPKLRVANSVASCVKIATDIWLVTGDVA